MKMEYFSISDNIGLMLVFVCICIISSTHSRIVAAKKERREKDHPKII